MTSERFDSKADPFTAKVLREQAGAIRKVYDRLVEMGTLDDCLVIIKLADMWPELQFEIVSEE